MSRKTKKWWNRRSEKEKIDFIDGKVKKKSESRRLKEEAESDKVAKQLGAGKVCSTCFHFKSNSCKGLSNILTKVCKYFCPFPHP